MVFVAIWSHLTAKFLVLKRAHLYLSVLRDLGKLLVYPRAVCWKWKVMRGLGISFHATDLQIATLPMFKNLIW